MILIALAGLAACVVSPPAAVFRTEAAPIYSAAAFAPGQITGSWRQVAGYAARPGGCRTGAVTFTPVEGGLQVRGTLCLNGAQERLDAVARPTGPGRLALAGQEDWWVLWVDSGYRTLAIGTPSGRFGFVLDRGEIPPDRLTAAGDIFDFNGYQRGWLRPF